MYVTLGGGCIFAKSTKQKLVAKSSTEAELIAVADSLPILIWMRLFLKAQGYLQISDTIIVFQDNLSTIALIKKGKSTSNRTRHIDIRYFFIYDRVKSGEMIIRAIRTDDMVGDFFSKELQGSKFVKFVFIIMNKKE